MRMMRLRTWVIYVVEGVFFSLCVNGLHPVWVLRCSHIHSFHYPPFKEETYHLSQRCHLVKLQNFLRAVISHRPVDEGVPSRGISPNSSPSAISLSSGCCVDCCSVSASMGAGPRSLLASGAGGTRACSTRASVVPIS